MNYETLFSLFENKQDKIDETSFYFKSDPEKTEHFIGFIPRYESPYWVGLCDIKGGCDFKTAKELFESPIFGGRSIKDRWDDIVLLQIGGISAEEWDVIFPGSERHA